VAPRSIRGASTAGVAGWTAWAAASVDKLGVKAAVLRVLDPGLGCPGATRGLGMVRQ
jgi:predicted naringenin-chalcone synthase